MTRHEELTLGSRTEDGPEEYRFRTADGLHSPEEFRDTELLLLETVWDQTPGSALVVQANYGVVGTVLDAITAEVVMTETSARAARICRANVDRNGADERIAGALSTLEPGGRLYLAARTETGLNRYEDCLGAIAAGVETVQKHGNERVLAAKRPAEFDPPTYVTPRTIEPTVDGVPLSLVTLPGLFSPTELDHGTRLLLECATVEDGDHVLDLACGYGAAGVYAASVADADVVLTDDDARATLCARRSLDASGVDGTVVTGDGARGVADRQFDRILCNPPTHAGDGVLTDLFSGAAEVLDVGGRMDVVHHSALDLDDLLEGVGSIRDRERGEEHTVVTVKATGSR
ncbi:rRNA (guanine-N2)-methyltransferase [Halobacteriales archaeon QH_6_66_25]|nr:MAG: rRNA (guanine-N2)-methyltransferase [Halobacteriales archaeon QH_6_66_25]